MAGIVIDLSKFRADLERIDISKRKDLLVQKGLEAVEPFRQAASQMAPSRTGRLAGDIQKQEDKRNSTVDVIEIDVGPSSKTFYGFFQEFGTAFHSPQPFMGPAMDKTATEIENRLVIGVNQIIQGGT